jgi:hypothetical protein
MRALKESWRRSICALRPVRTSTLREYSALCGNPIPANGLNCSACGGQVVAAQRGAVNGTSGFVFAIAEPVPRILHRLVNAIAFWCVVALAGLVTLASTGTRCTSTKEKAYVTAMKSDLRNLSVFQEDFATRHGRFATATEVQTLLRRSTGVLLEIDRADSTGWSAHTRHTVLKNTTCSIGAGDEMPVCLGQEKRPKKPLSLPTSNPELNFALDLWGVAITLAWRQRRLAPQD